MKIKNFKVTALAIMMTMGAMGVFFSSCQKETTEFQNSSNQLEALSAIGGSSYLRFTDRTDYENTINLLNEMSESEWAVWEDSKNFVSCNTFWADNIDNPANLNSQVADRLFLTLINKDGLIQIGNYLYKSQYNMGLCWTMGAEYIETDFEDFIAGNFDATKMNRFNSTIEDNDEIDFIDHVESGVVGVYQNKTRGIFGTDHKVNDDVNNSGVIWRAECKATYQNALFYKSLFTELKYMSGGPVVWTQKNTNIKFYVGSYMNLTTSMAKFKPKGNASYTGALPSGTQVNDNKLNWRPWGSSRKLNEYNIDIRFQYTDITNLTRDVYVGVKNF